MELNWICDDDGGEQRIDSVFFGNGGVSDRGPYCLHISIHHSRIQRYHLRPIDDLQ